MEARISMPQVLGGLGLRSAQITARAACWASFADALPEIREHYPTLAQYILNELQSPEHAASSLHGAAACRENLQARGSRQCPSWQAVHEGVRPAQVEQAEVGEWKHGWQYFAASRLEQTHRDTAVLPSMSPACKALLRSQSGLSSATHLVQIPTCPELTVSCRDMRTMMLRRPRLPPGLSAMQRSHLQEGAR